MRPNRRDNMQIEEVHHLANTPVLCPTKLHPLQTEAGSSTTPLRPADNTPQVCGISGLLAVNSPLDSPQILSSV